MPGPTTASPQVAEPAESPLDAMVLAALATVLDPEIDEPITQLGFVHSCHVDDLGVARVELRLPTFFCAPNFSYLMVADAQEAVGAVAGVSRTEISLLDHHAATEINRGVAAGDGFVAAFEGEADAELDEVRRIFLGKAALAGQDRVARPLVDGGATPHDLVTTTLGRLVQSVDVQRLRRRRRALGLPAGDDAPLLVDAAGEPIGEAQVPLHLRRARLTRLGMETNGQYCMSLLHARYPDTGSAGG